MVNKAKEIIRFVQNAVKFTITITLGIVNFKFIPLNQWFPTGVPWAGDKGAANRYNPFIFIPIKPARGAIKYEQY